MNNLVGRNNPCEALNPFYAWFQKCPRITITLHFLDEATSGNANPCCHMWKNPEQRLDAIAGNANPCCMRKNPEKRLDGIAENANPCRMRKNPKQRIEASSGQERETRRDRERYIHTSMAQGSFRYWQQSPISTTVGFSQALLVDIRRPSASVFLELMYTG
jgi:hypothetical protein